MTISTNCAITNGLWLDKAREIKDSYLDEGMKTRQSNNLLVELNEMSAKAYRA
jgi:hypothetical protein